MSTATIPAKDLDLLLATAKLNRLNPKLARFCLMSRAPMVETGCRSTARHRREAVRFGLASIALQPMRRGEIAEVYERVAREGGRAEVLRTWGTGIRTLRLEPRHHLKPAAWWQTQ